MNILYIVNTTSQDDLNSFLSLFKSTEYSNISRHFIFVIHGNEFNVPNTIAYNFESSNGSFFDDIIRLNEKYSFTAPNVVGVITDIKNASIIIDKEAEHLSNFEYKNVGASIAKVDIGYDYGWKLSPSNVYIGSGWYNREKSDDKYFIWSGIKSELYIKAKTANIHISNHNEQLKNVYVIFNGKFYQSFPIDVGDNVIDIIDSGEDFYKLEIIVDTFIPSDRNSMATDNRELGILLFKIVLDGIVYTIDNLNRNETYVMDISNKANVLETLGILTDKYYYTKTSNTGNFFIQPTIISDFTSIPDLKFDGNLLFFYKINKQNLIIKNV